MSPAWGHRSIQLCQERQELGVAFPRGAAGQDGAIQDVERGEQVGRAVAHIVVGLPSGNPRAQRQHRLGPIEGLHLGLLVHTEHQRFIGRMQVDAHDVAQLFHEVGVATELERLDPMRLQPVGGPDAMDDGVTEALGLGHRPHRSVGGIRA